MTEPVVLWWLRRDLRLDDNMALNAALTTGMKVLPVFILDPMLLKGERFSLPRLKFMLAGLAALRDELLALGSDLLVRRGDPLQVLPSLVSEFSATAVYANRDYSPYAIRRDQQMVAALAVPLHWFDDAVLHAPAETLKGDRTPYVVYSPYKRLWLTLPKMSPLQEFNGNGKFRNFSGVDIPTLPSLSDLGLPETIAVPKAGAQEAMRRLNQFTERAIFNYAVARNDLTANPFDDGASADVSSGLSPYFRFGMLSPRQAYAAALEARLVAPTTAAQDSVDMWVSELAWREFYTQILYRFPHVYNTSFRAEYERVEFRQDAHELRAWQQGETGYPVVDAAMRQMNSIGWMHNRARMIVSSFLTKDLLIYWREGDVAFMKALIDGDPAANNGGWQWAAGTGTDAQPYFRIFNPVSQSQKFDPDGAYIRRWVPELRGVPNAFIHEPWTMASPPNNYPPPIVDHKFARERTLNAFKAIKSE